MKRPTPTFPIDDTVARRLDVLARLIDDEYDKSPKEFEDRTGIKMSQVGQWFTGYRALREKAVKRLEEKTGKPAGWFDRPILSDEAHTTKPPPGFVERRLSGTQGAPPDLKAAIGVLAQSLAGIDPVDRAAAKAYLMGLCDAPDRQDLLDKVRAALDPPASHQAMPEIGTQRTA